MIKTQLFESHFIRAKKTSDLLMIVLHGKGDSLRPFMKFNDELEIPELNFLLLNAPKKYLDGYSWYGEPPFQRNGVLRVRQKLFHLINELEGRGWDSRKIFLLGFSQGCLVSTDLAMHYPRRFAGLVGVSGYFHFEPRWRKQVDSIAAETPWLLTHGTQDEVIPIEETKYGLNKLKDIGLRIDWVESDKKHTFAEEDYEQIKKWVGQRLSDLGSKEKTHEFPLY